MALLSVVIPAYNESHRIEATLRDVLEYLSRSDFPFELVVVDDGSTDGTAELVTSNPHPAVRLLQLPRNMGKGAAVKAGCLDSKGDCILFMDADHSTRIEEVEAFIQGLRNGHDLVVGVRTYQDGESRAQRIMGLTFLIFAHLFVFKKAVVDSQCGFKAFTREAAQLIFSNCRNQRGTIDVEIFYLAHKFGLKIFFAPVHWRNAPGSTISVWKCILRDPFDMLRIRVRDLFNRYSGI